MFFACMNFWHVLIGSFLTTWKCVVAEQAGV